MKSVVVVLGVVGALLASGGCESSVQTSPDAQAGPDAAVDAQVRLDALGPDATPDAASADGGTYVYTCTPVGDSFSDGFFTLATYNGQVYAGQFGYGYASQSMLFRYPAWEHVSPGLTGIGESVCAMKEFGGYLYANTEDSGDIFRSADGETWELVHNGDPGSIGCGLAELGGQLYAVSYHNQAQNHGQVLRQDGASWTVVYDSQSSPLYLREIVTYNGVLYAFAVMNGQGQMLSSPDGSNWTLQPVANRYFRGHVWGGYLWLGSADNYGAGEVAVWRFDGVDFLQVHPVGADQSHVADLQDLDGHLFASTSHGFKDASGPSYLLMSPDGLSDWQTVCTFSETAAWSMAVLGSDLYVGTWEFGHGGKVYRVHRELVQPTSCSDISGANAAWEVCETGDGFCAGVFSDGAGCHAFCAAAGLPATACFGGEPGCVQEPGNVLDCANPDGHQSDWCECGYR